MLLLNQLKVSVVALIIALVTFPRANAQELKLNWSAKQKNKMSKDGFMKRFIGSNESTVYTLFGAYKGLERTKVYTIIAYDKKNFVVKAEQSLRSSKDKKGSPVYGMTYLSHMLLKDKILIFWTLDKKNEADIYTQSFDLNLKPLKKLDFVSTIKFPEGRKGFAASKPALRILKNKGEEKYVTVFAQMSTKEKTDIAYVSFDTELEVRGKGKVELPLKKSFLTDPLIGFELGNDGRLYAKSQIRMERAERKKLEKGQSSLYYIVHGIDMENNAVAETEFKFKNKNIFDLKLSPDKEAVRFIGFYNDLEKDPSGSRTNGIFTAKVDEKSGQINDPVYVEFTKAVVSKLFEKDKEDKLRSGALTKKKRDEKKKKDDEAISESFTIEKIVNINQNTIIFASKMYNYTVQSCNSNGNCTTRYYCRKSNVLALSVNIESGEFNWASNLDRQKTYNGWDVYDLEVINTASDFYVIYGSDFTVNPDKKSGKSVKSKKERRDQFEYAICDIESGKFLRKFIEINPKGTKRKDRKRVNPLDVYFLNNELYLYQMKMKLFSTIQTGYLGSFEVEN